jgi:hypothetical protein
MRIFSSILSLRVSSSLLILFGVIFSFQRCVYVEADTLSSLLDTVPFTNAITGITNNSAVTSFMNVQCYYLEVENVTCTDCSWGGSCQLRMIHEGPLPPPSN